MCDAEQPTEEPADGPRGVDPRRHQGEADTPVPAARTCVKVMTVWRSSVRIQLGSSFMQLLLLLFCFKFVCVNKIIFKLLFVCVQIALDTAVSMSDPSIVVDILNIINPQP